MNRDPNLLNEFACDILNGTILIDYIPPVTFDDETVLPMHVYNILYPSNIVITECDGDVWNDIVSYIDALRIYILEKIDFDDNDPERIEINEHIYRVFLTLVLYLYNEFPECYLTSNGIRFL